MIHSFLSTLNILYPVFIYMSAGKLLKKRNLLNNSMVDSLNRLLFLVLLPIKLFIEIIQSDFNNVFNTKLIFFAIISIIFTMIISTFLITKITNNRKNISVIVQSIYRSNYIMYGIAIATSMYPGKDLGIISILAAFIVPFFNLISVILFEIFNEKNVRIRIILKKIFSNNIILSGILGLVFVYFKISIPKHILSPFIVIGNCSTPIGIMCIGTMISFESLNKYKKELVIMSLGRLVITPLILVPISIIFGFRNMELIALFILFSSPIATSSSPMAYEMGGNGELAGVAVAVTSVLVLFTMFLGIFILKTLALI